MFAQIGMVKGYIFFTLFLIASHPSLLKPIAFWMLSSSMSLKSLGFALPGCGFGVNVPNSKCPNPRAVSASNIVAFLSKPPAMPTGLW